MKTTTQASPAARYYICGGRDMHWTYAGASLHAAKLAANRVYHMQVGGKVEISERVDYAPYPGDDFGQVEYVKVAVKYGFDKWQCA